MVESDEGPHLRSQKLLSLFPTRFARPSEIESIPVPKGDVAVVFEDFFQC
jgi:hypothetical protein